MTTRSAFAEGGFCWTDPEVLQQAWFQLGIVYRRLHRMTEAQQAIATFQRLKNEQAEKSQEQLKKFKMQQDRR